MQKRLIVTIFLFVMILLTACGSPSKEDVVKKLSGKWDDTKGYELEATMEIKTGDAPRRYEVEVWHTKPDFYRVNVKEEGSGDSQMIVRNEKGVFVVAPSLGKTYQFQSNWPEQNSQAYLIEALAKDIQVDENSEMIEEKDVYIFKAKTRNNHQKVLPTQNVTIDRKTLLPKKVSVLDEQGEEQITIQFNKISLGVAHKKDEYAIEMDTEKDKSKESEKQEGNHEEDDEQEDIDEEANQSEEEDDADSPQKETSFKTYYPTIEWEDVVLKNEDVVETEGAKRVFMTYEGAKQFTLVEEKSQPAKNAIPVSVEGDPFDLGFTVAAITEKSIRWESGGTSFFLSSDELTTDEMIEVARSMAPNELK